MSQDATRTAISSWTTAAPGLTALSRPWGAFQEHAIHATRQGSEPVATFFRRVAEQVRSANAQIVSQDVFGLSDPADRVDLDEAFGRVDWPVTWTCCADHGVPAATQIWALADTAVETIRDGNTVVGCVFEDAFARYCRLGGVLPVDPTVPSEEQARSVFEKMERHFQTADMDFAHVVRTWFYNNDILAWYAGFNKVRAQFFDERGVSNETPPASTGIGAGNLAGAALVAGALAVQPKDASVTARTVPSPLQCEATAYGSSFSRAMEVATPENRRLLISGTASIEPGGATVGLGDVDAQVDLTMRVAGAILESRGFGWDGVTEGLAYIIRADGAAAFRRYRADHGIPDVLLPVPVDDICRGDLLFEIDAAARLIV